MDNNTNNAPLCKCGCGRHTYKRKNGTWRNYLQGHKSQTLPIETPPECACGKCHLPVEWDPTRKQWYKCIKGHKKANTFDRLEIKEPPLCKCGCGNPVEWNIKSRQWYAYIKNHRRSSANRYIEIPPLCACGCGLPVTWNTGNVQWNSYISGHNLRSAEMKEKIRLAINKSFANLEFKLMVGKKISESNRKYYADHPERNIQNSIAQRKHYAEHPERAKTHSEKLIRLYEENPELRIRQSAIIKRDYELHPERTIKMSIAGHQLWETPEYRDKMVTMRNDPEYIAKWLASWNRMPNKPERFLIGLFPDGVRYTGDGQFHRRLELHLPDGTVVKKCKVPDFKVTGQYKVIEFNGNYPHKDDYPDYVYIDAWKRFDTI